MMEELDEKCPKQTGPRPIHLKSTKTTGRMIIIDNGRQLKEMGIV